MICKNKYIDNFRICSEEYEFIFETFKISSNSSKLIFNYRI
jgi:hypothetical protein